MYKVKITVMKIACYKDLIEKYENPIEHTCSMKTGQIFISENSLMPADFCESAWQNIAPFVLTLAHGGSDFYDGWMKDKKNGNDFLQ